MTSLYNCRHSGDQYRISKFDEHFDLEASYLLDAEFCECPAGVRPKCRHREMLPKFIKRDAIGSNWFFDYDRGGWVQGEALLGQMADTGPLASAASTPPSIAPDEGGPIPSPSEPAATADEAAEAMNNCDYWNGRKSLSDSAPSEATPLDTKPEASATPTIRRRV